MMRLAIRQAARAVFWILASSLVCIAISVPAILNKLIFGSPF
ncbi:hypothetical protein [Arthrobacter sp. AL12]|nr:hypothetical protein [Arthrobacter sp. AL12]MDI3211693.1 hypothetical protein [Arthrobacter sp. AL12]